ncbi:MAG: 30S ribosomal protein S14 [Bdellovibrionales bacterium CG10_big_fil_rev_8_21_14_0_10_45_34]|nr:MAG: 30S ribosomal protein S14 [Bdellovibrionales bacterium CG10_big_fil_rev_8_21_14_0_10_45_34]
MAKLSKVVHTKRREDYVNRYRARRLELRDMTKDMKLSEDDRQEARRKLNNLPRLSIETRLKQRCLISGRPRGYLRKFQMSRIAFRELALDAKLPGVTKASW